MYTDDVNMDGIYWFKYIKTKTNRSNQNGWFWDPKILEIYEKIIREENE